MTIRSAHLADAAQISALISALSHYYLNNQNAKAPNWLTDTTTVEAVTERILSPDYVSFVCLAEQKIIGYISIKDRSHLFHLFVSAQHHGRGISRELWNTAKSATNATKYTLRSSIYAIPVYQRFGFELKGEALEKEGIQYQPMQLFCKQTDCCKPAVLLNTRL